jgi:hypothetical protein
MGGEKIWLRKKTGKKMRMMKTRMKTRNGKKARKQTFFFYDLTSF